MVKPFFMVPPKIVRLGDQKAQSHNLRVGESQNADLSSKIEMATQKTLRCPICRKEVALDDPNMPFCSDRCRVIDLGKWASGDYKITSPILDPDVLADLDNAQLRKLNGDTGDDD
jgi:uncharacterized protein